MYNILLGFVQLLENNEHYNKDENTLFKIENSPQLVPVELDAEYRKKWSIHPQEEYYHIVKDGKVLNNGTLYRKGGLYSKNTTNPYQLLLKGVEALYDKSITKVTKSDPHHLESHWVIIDKEGNEKVEFENFKSPYLVKGSCIYTVDNKYYNIETGEYYGESSNRLESADFIFIDTKYDWKEKDNSKKGVKKIDKKWGIVEFFEQ